MENIQLVFTPPSRTDKGYPKRLKKTAYFKECIDAGRFDTTLVEEMVGFLIQYVKVEGMDQEQVQEIMWDLSQEDFENLLAEAAGGKKEVPLAS